MRPVTRGADPGPFAQYRDAAEPLMTRLGCYCSYCERHIETHLAVEHIQPKDLNPALEHTWGNFLLACTNCNSCKGVAHVSVADYLWPDTDNTLRAFVYRHGLVEVEPALTAAVKPLAEALHRLVGLDKDPGNPAPGRTPTSADRRWLTRHETWQLATDSLQDLTEADTPQMRAQIVRTAKTRGGFGIWFTVFRADHDMLLRLIAAFPGSTAECFDHEGEALGRPGGRL
jgi:5-methylcytosine-specific restriction endonuclease McrA